MADENASSEQAEPAAGGASSAGKSAPRARNGRKGVPRVKPATAVHVPRQRGGVRRPRPEGEAVAVAEAEQPSAPQEHVEEEVTVREAKRPDPVPLPPPRELPKIEGLTFLDVQAPSEEAAPEEEEVPATVVALADRPVASAEPDSEDASHTKLLLMLFLCTLVGGAGAIAYFLSTQEVNPLEGLF